MARFGSLRTRLLAPLVACSVVSSVIVGWVSLSVATREVRGEMEASYDVIRNTLRGGQFPLTPPILLTLADLTGTQLVTYNDRGEAIGGTAKGITPRLPPEADGEFREDVVKGFSARWFTRESASVDGARRVLVLFDTAKLNRARRSAAAFPLATGLFATVVIAAVALGLSQRMIYRIGLLQSAVGQVAGGDFSASPTIEGDDELGQLGLAMRKMADDLRNLWRTVHQQERQRLIHQMAAGMAHQLRNSLTGARMAIDLVVSQRGDRPEQGLEVARREIRRTEDYVQRILKLAGSRESESHAGIVWSALEPTRESLEIIAKHHRVELQWMMDEQLRAKSVSDVASLSLAVENLVLNAIEAGGSKVRLDAEVQGKELRVRVWDNGPGLETLAMTVVSGMSEETHERYDDELFEPFVTTKPEGLGLGLSLVRRAAESLGGRVSVARESEWTRFTFTALLRDQVLNA